MISGFGTLKKRLLSGFLLVTVFSLVVVWDSPVAAALFAAVCIAFALLAVNELAGLLRILGYEIPTLLMTTTAVMLILAIGLSGTSGSAEYPAVEALLILTLAIALTVSEMRRPNLQEGAANLLLGLGGFIYIPWTMLALVKLYFFFDQPVRSGPYLFLFVVLVTKFADVGGYFAGNFTMKIAGRNHKLIPALSPGKSWEGLAGGILFSILTACLLVALIGDRLTTGGDRQIGYAAAIMLGTLLALVGLVGDLSVSMLKRAAGTKDSGSTIPGMGGILDVIDSLIFAAPCFLLYTTLALRRY